MIFEKGTKVLVHHTKRGDFCGVARRTFSLDDTYYPINVTDPMDSSCIPMEETTLVARFATVELVETEPENEFPNDEEEEIVSDFPDEDYVEST